MKITIELNSIYEVHELKKWLENPFGNETDIPISELGLGIRATNCLMSLGADSTSKIIKFSESQLISTPNMGRRSVNELKIALSKIGMKLA